jgi:hypothetical protein
MSGDLRDQDRLPLLSELQGEITVFQPIVVREISRGGVTIETQAPLHLDSLHDLRLTLGQTSVVLKGRVVHSEISDVDQEIVTYRAGLEFIEPSEHVATAISAFLDTIGGSSA